MPTSARAAVSALLSLVLAAVLTTLLVGPASAQSGQVSAAPRAVLSLARRVADWQLAQLAHPAPHSPRESDDPRSWEQGAFWVGLAHLADATGAPRYRDAILAQGRANQWRLGDRIYFADDQVIGQSYAWAAAHGAGTDALAPMRSSFDAILARPSRVHLSFVVPASGYGDTPCLKRWCWCDALFMGPPGWAALSRQTGDARYARFALSEFWATSDFLYDEEEHLFYRDSRFFDRRDAQGRKLFWSRGNGWVMAGTANLLDALPDDLDHARLERLFVDMAARIRTLQKPDGYWAPSLLAPENSPPETSGTGFFVFALAWGVNQGLLDRAEYEPAIRNGWAALTRAVGPDGRLGWVQQVSDRPDQVAESDTQFYGVGAFLLAGAAVAALDLSDDRPR